MVEETTATEGSGSWGLREGDEIVPGRTALGRLGISRGYEVYLAWDDDLYGLVAAKLVRRDRADDSESLEALRREAGLLRRLEHPVLPRCFAVETDAERPHVALEFIEGPRLSTVIRRQRLLSVEQVLPLALQVCSALHYLSRRGIVHLDVKPKNLIMAPPPKLIDLSVARGVAEARRLASPVGTDRYMAPEQCGIGLHHEIGPATDVWGLGVTLAESLGGRRPFPEGDPDGSGTARFPQLDHDPLPLPREVPGPLHDVIAGALERRPADRPTASEVADTLADVLERVPRGVRAGRFHVRH
jgi:serine/threonine protein kinase